MRVWLSAAFGFPTLEEQRATAEELVKLSNPFRQLGIGIALSLPNTIGHSGELVGSTAGVMWHNMVGPDGFVHPGCNCPRDRKLLNYLHDMITIYMTVLKPDAIWLNDDMRMQGFTEVKYACFCKECLADFSRLQRHKWSRKDLVEALNTHDGKFNPLRSVWSDFGQSSLTAMAAEIADAAYSVKPECRMGAQLGCSGTYSGNYVSMLRALGGKSGKPVGIRPGGGFYNDAMPRAMLYKSFLSMALVDATKAANLGQICYEMDSYPYTVCGKSAHGMAVESTLALATGSDSLSHYHGGADNREDDYFYEQRIAETMRYLPLWRMMRENNALSSPYGAAIRYSKHHNQRPLYAGENDWSWAHFDFDKVYEAIQTGLPLFMGSGESFATLLSADAIKGYTDDELMQVFAGKTIVDGAALEILSERKLDSIIGVGAERIQHKSVREEFTADPLNGTAIGHAFYASGAVYRLKLPGGERILSELYPRFERRGASSEGIASAIVQNNLGGVTAAIAYVGIPVQCSIDKHHQLQAIWDFMAGGLAASLRSPGSFAFFPRIDASGKFKSACIFNLSIGESRKLEVRFKYMDKLLHYIRPGLETISLHADNASVILPPLQGWGVGYLYCEQS